MRGQGDFDIFDGFYDCGIVVREIKVFLVKKEINFFYLVGYDVGVWVVFIVLKFFLEVVLGVGLIDVVIFGLVSNDFFFVVNVLKVWQFYFYMVLDLVSSLVIGKENEYFSWYFINKFKWKQNFIFEVMDYYVCYYSCFGVMKVGFFWYFVLEEIIKVNIFMVEMYFSQLIFIMGGEFVIKFLIYNGLFFYCDDIIGYVIEQCGYYIFEEVLEEIFQVILIIFVIIKEF